MSEERDNQQQTTQGIPLPGQPDKIPDFLQGDNWYTAEIEGDMLNFGEPYRPPRYTMERGGIPFADVGEMHIVSGKPGNGKTGLMSQFEASTLAGSFGELKAREVVHRIKNEDTGEIEEKVVPVRMLHIDTE